MKNVKRINKDLKYLSKSLLKDLKNARKGKLGIDKLDVFQKATNTEIRVIMAKIRSNKYYGHGKK